MSRGFIVKKRRNEVIIIFLLICIAIIAVYKVAMKIKNKNAQVKLTNHQEKNKIINYNKKDAGYYTDYYNGYRFKLGSDYSAKVTPDVQGETIVYPNTKNANGSVFILTYTDNEQLTLIDLAYTMIPIKSELRVYIDGKFDNIEGYDYGQPQYGNFGGKEVAVEVPRIRYDHQWMKSTIYHFFGEDKEQVIVGYIAKDTASAAVLKKEAETIVHTFTFYDSKERAADEESKVSKLTLNNRAQVGSIVFNYPTTWQAVHPTIDQNTSDRQSLIFKASRAKNSQFQKAGLYVAEDSSEGDDSLDLKFNYALSHRDGIGASILQYPELIEPNITVIYDNDDSDTVNIQGEKSTRYSISIHINAEDQELDVPYTGVIYQNAYLYTIDHNGKSYIFVFSYNGIDRYSMKKLSKKIMDSVTFLSN